MSEVFCYVKRPLEELRDLLPGTDGFDFGTSPHGLSADLRPSQLETRERPPARPSAKPLLSFGETQPPAVDLPSPVLGTNAAVSLPVDAVSTARSAAGARTERCGKPEAYTSPEPSTEGAHPLRNKPNVYTSAQVRSSCRCIRLAATELASKPPYYLRLSDREFLQVYEAVNHDRGRTRKAIGKGLCEIGDLRASDPLWQILQDVMTRRMKGYRL